jgi:chromate transporter
MMPTKIPFWEAFRFWLKLGFISFGGPAGQIAMMHQELVDKRRWLSEGRFMHALNYCMVLPGPEAQQLATYIGWLMHRTWGGIVAGLFFGIKPAVTAIVLHAAWRIGSRALKSKLLWAIAGAAFVAIFAFGTPFPAIVVVAGLIGYLAGRKQPVQPESHGQPEKNAKIKMPALIDDDTPMPEHALFRWSRLLTVAVIGALLWAVPMGLLTATLGWNHTLTQMGWFFTKAALLTFGGAYAVLPYVYQGAVTHFGWLTPTQMIDGLALGETTPGPLIMVVAFVGFVGGYQTAQMQALVGPENLFLAGVIAASLVTWFTFLPSFIFILLGGPLVETTHGNLNFTAPLTAITAAVVGVILNLALFFAWHVFWPAGFSGHFEVVAAGITIAAGIALFRYQANVMLVIAACAVSGLLLRGWVF